MLIVKALLAFLSIVPLAALVGYAAWAFFKPDTLSAYLDAHDMSWKQKTFLGLAALAFLFCMYAGAEALLGWLPSSWGHITDDGTFQSYRSAIAGLFAFLVGVPLVQILERAPRESFSLSLLREAAAQEREVYAAVTSTRLVSLKSRFETKIKELRKDQRQQGEMSVATRRRLIMYEDLARLAEKRKLLRFIEARHGQLLGLTPQKPPVMGPTYPLDLALARAVQMARFRGVSWDDIEEIERQFISSYNNAKSDESRLWLLLDALNALGEKGDDATQEELSALETAKYELLEGALASDDEEEDETQYQNWLVQWERQLGRHPSA